jgi:hypothetical protein
MYGREGPADLLGLSRHHAQICGDLLLQRGSAARGLFGAHDSFQLIWIAPLLQLINT